MSGESFPKAYEAKQIESKWVRFWQENSLFTADPSSKKPAYTIVMPPPNVTGVLHMGHALVNTLQDILIRYKRMQGYEVLWIPGTDHAGIATQTVVEKRLMASHGKRRKEFSRDEFLRHVWEWKEKSEGHILEQVKRLGCSCDWTRLCFTMDEKRNLAVRVMFKKLYDQGLIYKGDYLVNWDPVTQTALADDEVEYEEQNTFLWHIRYPLADGSAALVIATTRPETMLGDTAVAVHPSDERYMAFIGKEVALPLTGRKVPVIADHRIDPAFGTGAVKVTPAHDPNDYQMGITHDLPFLNILTPDGKLNEHTGPFQGLSIEEARKTIVDALQKEGFLEKIVAHTNRVGLSYRSKAVIQPYLSKQWFVKMAPFKEKLKNMVVQGQVKFIPKHFEQTYFHWIDNLRDWCISRQLWWGHRIPIWYDRHNPTHMICFDGEGAPPGDYIQEEDVLDTWFSSALWPFSTLGWPEETPDFKKFYPNAVLVTGHDILFFWVARMLLMGEFATSTPPFPKTFLHGLIYGKSDEPGAKWEKMSKSKGNVIDPIEMIDLYGTDALRMALTASATQARQIDLDRRRFEEFKNFANKVWNGARFVLMNVGIDISKGLNHNILDLEDRWILSSLNRLIKEVHHDLDSYLFDKYAQEVYDFFWKEFCAYYVEIVKPVLFGKKGTSEQRENKQVLLTIILLATIRLMHPLAPFITEELFLKLKEHLAPISHTISSEGVQDGASDLFSPGRKHCPSDKESPGEGEDDATDCQIRLRECEKWGLGKQKATSSCPYTEEALVALQAKALAVAPFPKVIAEGDISEAINSQFALLEEIVYTIRNIRGEMRLAPGMATDIYLITERPEQFQSNSSIITSLVPTKELFLQKKEPDLAFFGTQMVDGIKIILSLPEELRAKEQERLKKEEEKLLLQLQKTREQLSNQAFLAKAPVPLVEKLRAQEKEMEQALAHIRERK